MKLPESIPTQLGNIKKGSALARGVENVEAAVAKLASMSAGKMDDRMVDAGTIAWGAALERLQLELSRV